MCWRLLIFIYLHLFLIFYSTTSLWTDCFDCHHLSRDIIKVIPGVKTSKAVACCLFKWLFPFPSDAISSSSLSLVPLGLREDTETQLIPKGQPLSDPDPPAGGHGRPAAVLCVCCRGPGCVRQVVDGEGAGVPVQSPVQGLHSVQGQPEWIWMVQIWTQPLAFKRSALRSVFGAALSRWEEPTHRSFCH